MILCEQEREHDEIMTNGILRRAFLQNENGKFHYGIRRRRKKAKKMFAWNTKFNFNEMENYVLFIYLLPLP